jgi:hypothetical protein
MSMLGKVLANLNVVLALAFAALIALDWGQRQNWTFGTYRAQLALDGLPVDETELDNEGMPRVNLLSDKTFKEVLPDVNEATPEARTQVAEVKRVQDRLRAEVAAAGDDKAKRQKLASILVPLAQTLGEREALQQQITKDPIDQLMGPDGPFDKAFNQALKNQSPQGKPVQGADARRQAIAHLLVNTAQDENARRRVVAVIGLRSFAAAAARQADALRDMAERVTLALANDQAQFGRQYQQGIDDLQGLAAQIDERKQELQRQQALHERHNALLNARVTDAANLKKELDAARQSTQSALAELAKEQRRLFDAQRRVTTGLDQNLKLEREIRSLEQLPGGEGR